MSQLLSLSLTFCWGIALNATPVPPVDPPLAEQKTVTPDQPPPSTYDRLQTRTDASDDEASPEASSEIDWSAQLIKTFVALLIVVALIYVVFKVGLARFVGSAAFRSGKVLRVEERIQLDGRHALLIVNIQEGERLLLGTGEQGVQLIARLDQSEGGAGTRSRRISFRTAMGQTASPEPDSTRADGGDSHDED